MQRKRCYRVFAAVGLCASLGLMSACSRDVRLAGKDVPTVTVRAVEHYSTKLDANATPEQVAYVALLAIRDDYLARDEETRKRALATQFDVCAADVIQARNTTSIERDEFVYDVVYRWTPAVSHYVGDFPTDWASAEARMVRRPVTRLGKQAAAADADDECEVAMVARDPGGDPNAQVVLLVWLAKDNGFWRVTHLGFDPSARAIKGK